MQVYKVRATCSKSAPVCIFKYAISVTGCASRNLYHLFASHVNTKYGISYHRTALWNALQMALYDQMHFEILI